MNILSLFTLSMILTLHLHSEDFSLVKPISVERAATQTITPEKVEPKEHITKVQVKKVAKTQVKEPAKDFTKTEILDINFKAGSSDIPESDLGILENFKNYLNEHKGYQAIVYSHTDSIGSESTNLILSEQRAKNIKKALENMGISSTRLTAIGKGEKEPIADNRYKDGRNQNRRIEVLIIK